MKKASKAEVDQTSTSNSKDGPSKQPEPIIHLITRSSNHSDVQPMETDFCGPSLPPSFVYSSIMAPNYWILSLINRMIPDPITQNDLRGCLPPKPRNTRTRRNTKFGQNTIHSLHRQRRISPLFLLKSAKTQQASTEFDQQQDQPDPVFYRW